MLLAGSVTDTLIFFFDYYIMTKTRRAGFRKKRRRGGRKTVKRRGGKRKTIRRRGGKRKTIRRRGGKKRNKNLKGGWDNPWANKSCPAGSQGQPCNSMYGARRCNCSNNNIDGKWVSRCGCR